MTSKDFVNWLSGYLDALGVLTPASKDVETIREKISQIKESSESTYVPFHRVSTEPYRPNDYYPPNGIPYVGDFPPFGGTTVSYDYRSFDSNTISQKNVDQEDNSEN